MSAAFAAQAAAPCDVVPVGQTVDEALATLRRLEPECHKHPQFLYTLGRILNQAGRYDEAIDPLEGALLYRPDHWPSQLEYAIALEGTGDRASVVGLLGGLLQNPAVDEATRQQIMALERRPVPSPAAQRHAALNLSSGYDNNLLGSTYVTQFSLTTPNGNLPVQLDEEQRPRAGSFIRADISYGGLLAASAGAQWRYAVAANYRNSPDYAPANLGQLSAQVERNAAGEQGAYLLGQHQTQWRADAVALHQTQLGAGYDFFLGPNRTCQQRVGLDLQQLSYPSSPALNGHYTGVISQTNCAAWGLQVQLRSGEDQPTDATRPGGAQRQASFRVSKHTPVAAGSLSLEWDVTQQDDQAGYSPLLDNNAPRSITRTAYRLEYRWQAGAVSPYLGFEWLDQRSNLSLFEMKNRVLTLGLRFGW